MIIKPYMFSMSSTGPAQGCAKEGRHLRGLCRQPWKSVSCVQSTEQVVFGKDVVEADLACLLVRATYAIHTQLQLVPAHVGLR